MLKSSCKWKWPWKRFYVVAYLTLVLFCRKVREVKSWVVSERNEICHDGSLWCNNGPNEGSRHFPCLVSQMNQTNTNGFSLPSLALIWPQRGDWINSPKWESIAAHWNTSAASIIDVSILACRQSCTFRRSSSSPFTPLIWLHSCSNTAHSFFTVAWLLSEGFRNFIKYTYQGNICDTQKIWCSCLFSHVIYPSHYSLSRSLIWFCNTSCSNSSAHNFFLPILKQYFWLSVFFGKGWQKTKITSTVWLPSS